MKSSKIISYILLFIFLMAMIYFVYTNNMIYILVFTCLFIVTGLNLIRLMQMEYTPTKVYQKKIKKIIRTYDAILVEIDTLPKLADKKIIKATSFKDMINAEYELRKPIYYINDEHSCDFILLNKKSAYIYTAKDADDIMSALENYIIATEADADQASRQLDILDDLDKTTVIQLDDTKKVVVSPVRKKKKLQSECQIEPQDYQFFVKFENIVEESEKND